MHRTSFLCVFDKDQFLNCRPYQLYHQWVSPKLAGSAALSVCLSCWAVENQTTVLPEGDLVSGSWQSVSFVREWELLFLLWLVIFVLCRVAVCYASVKRLVAVAWSGLVSLAWSPTKPVRHKLAVWVLDLSRLNRILKQLSFTAVVDELPAVKCL